VDEVRARLAATRAAALAAELLQHSVEDLCVLGPPPDAADGPAGAEGGVHALLAQVRCAHHKRVMLPSLHKPLRPAVARS
jgi:hypothetical protein